MTAKDLKEFLDSDLDIEDVHAWAAQARQYLRELYCLLEATEMEEQNSDDFRI